MKRLDLELKKLNEEYEEKRDEMLEAREVLDGIPEMGVYPRHVHFVDSENNLPWVEYEAESMEEAFDILNGFAPFKAVRKKRGSCTSLGPEEYNKDYDDITADWEVEDAVLLDQHGGRGFYSAELKAWPEKHRIKLIVGVTDKLPRNKRSSIRATYDRFGRVSSAELEEVKLATTRVRYHSGMGAFHIVTVFKGVGGLKFSLEGGKK